MISYAIFVVLFLIIGFPLKNWFEIKEIKVKDAKWSAWLLEKPSREQYCQSTNQNIEDIKCDYCSSNRQFSILFFSIPYQPKFGIFFNEHSKQSYFKAHLCSKCNTQLYRERYED